MKEEPILLPPNPEKAASRVAINGVMLASLFVILSVVFLNPDQFRVVGIAQILFSIPFLFVSSLAYSKVGYWKETRLWNAFGYVTLTFGNFFMINAMGLFVAKISYELAMIYFAITIILLIAYSLVQINYRRSPSGQLIKFLFSSSIILIGGIIPLIVHK